MNVVKTLIYIGLADFFVFFSGKSLKILHFLSSIEIHLLKVTLIPLSHYERAIGAKIREPFLVSKEFIF